MGLNDWIRSGWAEQATNHALNNVSLICLTNASILGKRNHPLTLLLDLPVSTSLIVNSKLATLDDCFS